jgi:hypothetical protein
MKWVSCPCFLKIMISGAISSASLPSHKTRWNSEEDDRLGEALVIHKKERFI